MGVGKMSKCQCDLRTKLVGDGCRYCNAQEYIDKLIEALEEQRTWVGLTETEVDECYESVMFNPDIEPTRVLVYQAIEAKLKEKNT